jgi:hypothetical protein
MSYARFAIVATAFVGLVACADSGPSPNKKDIGPAAPKSTQHNLSLMAKLRTGISKEEVEKMVGLPAIAEITPAADEWHYCSTGEKTDRFMVLKFASGKLVSARHYQVDQYDAKGQSGDCALFVKMGTYRDLR